MTNRERIHAMSDKEFAELLIQYDDSAMCFYTPSWKVFMDDEYLSAVHETVEWLNEECED